MGWRTFNRCGRRWMVDDDGGGPIRSSISRTGVGTYTLHFGFAHRNITRVFRNGNSMVEWQGFWGCFLGSDAVRVRCHKICKWSDIGRFWCVRKGKKQKKQMGWFFFAVFFFFAWWLRACVFRLSSTKGATRGPIPLFTLSVVYKPGPSPSRTTSSLFSSSIYANCYMPKDISIC